MFCFVLKCYHYFKIVENVFKGLKIRGKMDWLDWVGKIVFVKLKDGAIFSYSKVLAYEDPYLSITDRDGLPVVIHVLSIERIKEEGER